jgi:hypothetical protein
MVEIIIPPPVALNVDYTITTNVQGGHDINLFVPGDLSTSMGTSSIDNVFYSVSQPLTLPSNIENIVLGPGGGGGDQITGNGLNNTFTVKGGSWSINGNGGTDTVVFSNPSTAYVITQTSTGFTVVGPEGTQQLSNISQINFSDIAFTVDTSANAKSIFTLFEATFGRAPDAQGEAYWLGQLNGGASLSSIAAKFVASSEFQSHYGASLTDTQFIAAVYQNALGRAPDAAGLAYWTSALAKEGRAGLLADFANGAESQSHEAALIGQGVLVAHPLGS